MKKINHAIKNIAKKCFKFINQEIEIKVIKKCDRLGNSYWLVFDPSNRSYSYFYSEAEVRMWLEQSYYR